MKNIVYEYDSPLGVITLQSDGEYLTGVSFGKRDCKLETKNEIPVLEQTARWLDVYFKGNIPDFMPPIKLNVTPFCREVCEILLTIPYGQTMSYGEIAKIIAERRGIARMSAQAVGGAVHRNPIAIIIPCHRVVGADGSLTGYAAGLDIKEKLLRLERIKK